MIKILFNLGMYKTSRLQKKIITLLIRFFSQITKNADIPSSGRRTNRKAAVILEPNVVKLLPEEMGEVEDDAVVLRMAAVVLGRHVTGLTTTGPGQIRGHQILGTMGSGTIAAMGPDVYGQLAVGDKVAIEPIIYCGDCIACSRGMYDSCRNRETCGLPPKQGFISEYYAHPWKLVHKLPEDMTLSEGSLCYVTANCINAYVKGGVTKNSRVAVVGVNLEGALACKVFTKMGVASLVAIDNSKWRLEVAKSLGATRVVNTIVSHPPLNVTREIVEDALRGKADIVIDVEHSSATTRIVKSIICEEGTVVLLGPPNPMVSFNCVRDLESFNKGLKVLEIQYYGQQFRNALSLLAGENISQHLATYEIPVSRILEGLTVARSNLSFCLATIVRCDL